MKPVIILIGSPGAGKGSQADVLKKELDIPHISTGNIIRDNLTRETPLGLAFKEYIDAGKLGPDELIFSMIFDRIAAADCQRGYILDGFPRNLAQAKALREHLDARSIPLAIHLEVPDSVVVERLTGRMTCKECSAPYHRVHAPPAREGTCDGCEGALYERSDDAIETVKNRLTVYWEETSPIIDFYSKASILHTVDATLPRTEVTQKLLGLLRRETKDIPIGVHE